MESLPPDIVWKISQDLTLRDMAHCCAVSCKWRKIFNQDWLWRPHCDRAFVKPLDTTPCMVEPVFVSPESEASTLTPISRWRLAFIKEHHLWKNWKQGKRKEEEIFKLDNEIQRSFLTDTLLVRWCTDRIELWDVSVIPATFVAKTDIEGPGYYSVFGTNGLLIRNMSSVNIFHVDTSKERVIELKHNIQLDVDNCDPCNHFALGDENLIKGNTYVYINESRSSLVVIDLENGTKKQSVSCPVRSKLNVKPTINGIKSSPTSSNVIVIIHVPWDSCNETYYCYAYNILQHMFLPGPIHKHWSENLDYFAIHKEYLAVSDSFSLLVYNCYTSLCLFIENVSSRLQPQTFNGCFIFTVEDDKNGYSWFGMLSPSNKTLAAIYHVPSIKDKLKVTITNNKFVTIWLDSKGKNQSGIFGQVVGGCEASGTTLKLSDIPNIYHSEKSITNHEVSQAFVRGIGVSSSGLVVYYYW